MQLEYTELPNKILLEKSKNLAKVGVLSGTNQFLYLDISNTFIHQLFPLIEQNNIKKPNYFCKDKSAGAHISIIYPGELDLCLNTISFNEKYGFDVKNFGRIIYNLKEYYVLNIHCPMLSMIREKLGLCSLPFYKGFRLPCLHVTIATN